MTVESPESDLQLADMQEYGMYVLALTGNLEARGILLDDNINALYAFAAEATLNVEDAEAVTQRTFEGAFSQQAPDQIGGTPFKIALFQRAVSESRVQAALESPIGATPTGHPEVLQQFTFEERHVIVLAYVSKCSRDEIAEILDITPERIDEIIDDCRSRISPST